MVIGLLSALLGGLQACFTNDLKRVLAYSTVSQLGYMVYAVGVGAVFASQFHLLNHSIFKALLFLAAGSVIHALGTRDMRAMGAVRKTLPFVFWVFLIGALALVGIPLTNGFFSKEMILEHGLEAGPGWAYVGMLIATAMTSVYVIRMLWMVFFGDPAGERAHADKQSAMKVSLGVLGLGVVTSWMIAGRFSQTLLASLPFHEWLSESTIEILIELLRAPSTWITLLVIVAGAGAWLSLRQRPKSTEQSPATRFVQGGLGFEAVNRSIVRAANGLSAAVRITQTGQLQWNLLGLVGALILFLCLMAIGA